jgi:SPP1 gp7 family putative phage head morphogenesis protein
MKPQTFEPIIYRDSWHKELAYYIFSIIKTFIFDPINDNENLILNAKKTDLQIALEKGDLIFTNGYFLGNLNSKISQEIKKLGGKFRKGKWHLDYSSLPENIRNIVDNQNKLFEDFSKKLDKKFSDMMTNIREFLSLADFENFAQKPISRISEEFKRTVKNKIAISPKISKEGKQKLIERYFKTEELPIRENTVADFKAGIVDSVTNFSQEIVEKLRKDLDQKIKDGIPRKELSKFIRSRLKISKQRSDFIARQETALLTVEIKKQQYEQFGIRQYKWITMGDHKVRERHIELNGDIIDWNNPPVVDKKTGRKAHAGQDFRCRCVDKPIVTW